MRQTDELLARWRAFMASDERRSIPAPLQAILAAVESELAAPSDAGSALDRRAAVERAAALLTQLHPAAAAARARLLEKHTGRTFARSVTQALEHEERRLAALRGYHILDTPPEPEFTDLVFIAAHVCAVPIAAINLIDRDRQWTKASLSMETCEVALGDSACGKLLGEEGCVVVPDMRDDPRLADLASVRDEPNLRFYASAPLATADGLVMGRLCVVDTEPRPGGLTREQAAILESLARQVMAQIRLRRLLSDGKG